MVQEAVGDKLDSLFLALLENPPNVLVYHVCPPMTHHQKKDMRFSSVTCAQRKVDY